jgi:hypothetical protein
LKFVEAQVTTGAGFFDHQADKVEVRLPAGQNDDAP